MADSLASRKHNIIRRITGIFAIASIVFWTHRIISNILIIVSDYEQLSYPMIMFIGSQLAGVPLIIAMIMFAVYVFGFYGKKNTSLVGFSAIMIVVGKFLLIVMNIFSTLHMLIFARYLVSYEWFFSILVYNIVIFLFSIAISIVLIIIGLRYFNKIDVNIIAISSVYVILSILHVLIISLLAVGLNFETNIYADLLSFIDLVPFLLFAFICPSFEEKAENEIDNNS